jgi:hypothetical protein
MVVDTTFDLTTSKRKTSSHWPDGTIAGQGLYDRIEPILTPSVFKDRFLFGIPLVAPQTQEKLTNKHFMDYIKRAVSFCELDIKASIMPTIARERLPFDPFLYQRNMYCEVPVKPIQKVIRLAICSASYRGTGEVNENSKYPSGNEIYQIPPDWIDTSYAAHGKIFVNPMNPAFASIGAPQAAAVSGATMLQYLNFGGWLPAFWTVEVLHGICDEVGNVPVIINELIGQKAAILCLDNLIPLYRTASQSLGIDGLSQSVNDLGHALLTAKRKDLAEAYINSVRSVKQKTGNSFFVSNI